MSRMSDSQNGIRQPHSAKSLAGIQSRAPPITASARKNPSVAVVWIQLVS